MDSPTFVSDSGGESEAFSRLHTTVQHWVYEHGWTTLHDAQERAIVPIVEGKNDVIIAAATASGKTEAAFLPICSVIAESRDHSNALAHSLNSDGDRLYEHLGPIGIEVLYVSPLKALINDQFYRMEQLCERIDIAVHRWHGDVSSTKKHRLRKEPSGILLITPESLEALFVNQGPEVPSFFAGLRYVVVDELHSFLSTPRGAQLQSLLSRVELAIRRRPPRIGLSATLGDMNAAKRYLRPTNPTNVLVIGSESDQQSLSLQVRGYRIGSQMFGGLQQSAIDTNGANVSAEVGGGHLEIADHLYRTLRGTDNLVFANARREVEIYADLLARRCERERVPNEFFPHHGSLAKEVRETVEAKLKDRNQPVTAICTSTLEMGIDIGSVTNVAQIGVPPSVAGLRQRLGRSGRRGEPAVIRVYVAEEQISPASGMADLLRCNVVQAISMVRLLLAKWFEPPDDPGFNYSTLVQQILSVIAQHGGATASELHGALCGSGSFDKIDARHFADLLRAMATAELIMQTGDGLLLHGPLGERLVNHYEFYAAFESPQEWKLFGEGHALGSIPILRPIIEGEKLIFAGRRWKIITVDTRSYVIGLAPATGGIPPQFSGDRPSVGDRVRLEMSDVYRSEDVPQWLDDEAKDLLSEGRDTWHRFGLSRQVVIPTGNNTLVLPWSGDRSIVTTSILLGSIGLDVSADGPIITVADCSPLRLVEAAAELLHNTFPDPIEIARQLKNPQVDKWDWVLTDDLIAEATAVRSLDIEGARRILNLIVGTAHR